MEFEFEYPMSIVSVGNNVIVCSEKTIHYAVQYKNGNFVPWTVVREIEPPNHLRAGSITHSSVTL